MPNIGPTKIHDDAVQARHIDADQIDGTHLATTPASRPGIEVVIPFSIPDTAGDYDLVMDYKVEVIGVQGLKRGGAGGAGDTVTVKKGSTAITNAISLNVVDNAPVSASTIDDAASGLDKGDTLRVTAAKATDCEALVMVRCLKRA